MGRPPGKDLSRLLGPYLASTCFFVDSPTLSAVNLGSFQLFAILQNTQIKLRLKYVSCSGLIFPFG